MSLGPLTDQRKPTPATDARSGACFSGASAMNATPMRTSAAEPAEEISPLAHITQRLDHHNCCMSEARPCSEGDEVAIRRWITHCQQQENRGWPGESGTELGSHANALRQHIRRVIPLLSKNAGDAMTIGVRDWKVTLLCHAFFLRILPLPANRSKGPGAWMADHSPDTSLPMVCPSSSHGRLRHLRTRPSGPPDHGRSR